jgi:ankyrin repeat protein
LLNNDNDDDNVRNRKGQYTNDGSTALMFSSNLGHKEVVELLLNHGVDIDLKSKHGKTALDLANGEEIKEMFQNHVNTSYVLK